MCAGGTIFPRDWPLVVPEHGSGEKHVCAMAKEARATGVHMLSTLVIEPNRDPRLAGTRKVFPKIPIYVQGLRKI